MNKMVDITGQRFGKLTVLYKDNTPGKQNTPWFVQCDCGTIKTASSGGMRHGKINSCGCIKREQDKSNLNTVKHGASGRQRTGEYYSWLKMRERCNSPSHLHYKNYGGRGIKVCDRWQHSFENFLADMGKRPEGKSLDRIDNNGNYEPSNCKWSTRLEQAQNVRPRKRANQ